VLRGGELEEEQRELALAAESRLQHGLQKAPETVSTISKNL
jgi:hypothetical protein